MTESRPTNFLNDSTRSAQEAYYEYMLRKDKLGSIATAGAAGENAWLSAAEVSALASVGEKEKIEVKILARLSSLADSSPELLQVKALTDCKSREECARSLADIYYRKYTTEEILNRFIDPVSTKSKILEPARAASAAIFGLWGRPTA